MVATKSELWTQLSKGIKIMDETLKYGMANATNFVSLLDTFIQSMEGTHVANTISAANSMRSSLSSIVVSQNLLNSIILELAKIGYASRATSTSEALINIWDGMSALSETVKSRAWTYGSVTPYISNVGNGTIYRLTKEEDDGNIEIGSYVGGVIQAIVDRDKNNGATEGAESFTLGGFGISPTDGLDFGTVPSGKISINATRPQDGKLTNPSFTTYTGTGATLAFTGWTLTDATKAAANTTTYYRKDPSGSAPVSLEFTDNNEAIQYLDNASSKITDTTKPVFLIVRYRRSSACDGTLTIRLGSQTTNVVLTTKTDATWYDLAIAVDKKCYYDVFKENPSPYTGLRIGVALTSRTTGTLLIDDIILAQPQVYDGKWYLITSGNTDFIKGDYFTFTDTVLNTGRIQTTLARLYNFTLPHTSGSPTYADA